ncbi:hypothetical protein M434DRAFT_400242, partial [Hypoxylon sp. CO27-5]
MPPKIGFLRLLVLVLLLMVASSCLASSGEVRSRLHEVYEPAIVYWWLKSKCRKWNAFLLKNM